MLGALRRGQALPKVLRSCSSRLAIPSQSRFQVGRLQTLTLPTQTQPLALRQLHSSTFLRNVAAEELIREPEASVDAPKTIRKFQDLSDLGLVSNRVIDVITREMNIETMTEVQEATINATLKGTDVVAQAKTGTGKTLAFLVPVLQRILQDTTLNKLPRRGQRSGSDDIRAIIVSPTRELAEQIAVEASKVASKTGVIVQTAVGGTKKREGLNKIQRQGCHILVGTPGRLNDILSDSYNGVEAPNLDAFVLDEADRLLDQGFAPAIEEMLSHLPERADRPRQTLMFSATMPREVMGLVSNTMKPDFQFVQTVKDDEEPTHMRVPQKFAVLDGIQNQLPALFELGQAQMEKQQADPNTRPFKAICYFNSTAEVSLAKQIFENMSEGEGYVRRHLLPNVKLIEMQSKLTQEQRTRNSQYFRHAQSAILFSSDVTARGMDFPNVTHVIQFGIPRDAETYVHRLGRTGRAGKEGEGYLFIQSFEMGDLRNRLHEMPLKEDTELQTVKASMSKDGQLPEKVASIFKSVNAAARGIPGEYKDKAYRALLGVYSGFRNKQKVIDGINATSKYLWGMPEPPAMTRSLIQKIGFGQCDGINFGGGDDGGFRSRGSFGGRDGRDSGFSRGSGGSRGGSFGGSRGGSFGGSRGGSRGGSYGGSRDSNRGGDRDRYGGGGFSRGGDRGGRGGFGRDRSDRGDFAQRRERPFGDMNGDKHPRFSQDA